MVGHSGLERAYDRWLRGRDGTLNVTVDAQGNPQGRATLVPAPVPGRDVRLTIDLDLQHAAEQALRKGIAVAREPGGPEGAPMPHASRGALIVMDVKTGAVRAMASWPSFDPRRTVGKGSDEYFAKLFAKANEDRAPLLNRTTDGVYPPGSTFKPVTAIASIESGLSTASDEILCGKDLVVDGQNYKNFETDTDTFISLRTALSQSCDTYFYAARQAALRRAPRRTATASRRPLWMRRLGFGAPTGLDIPDAAGVAARRRVQERPVRQGSDQQQVDVGRRRQRVHRPGLRAGHAAADGVAVRPDRERRHAGHAAPRRHDRGPGRRRRQGAAGSRPGARSTSTRSCWRRSAAACAASRTTSSGTAAHAFAGFPVGVAGKTGTAQKPPLADFAWFAGYAPIEDPQLVAVAVIEQGGFGGVGAATAVREAFAAAFNARAGKLPTRYRAKDPVREGRVADHQRPGARRSRGAGNHRGGHRLMTPAIFFRRLDYVLLAAIAGVVTFGSVTILSVAGADTERRHLVYVGIGVCSR